MRPGQKLSVNPGPDFGVWVVQPAAPPGLIPFSLYYTTNDDTDCGNNPSVMNLHQGLMTCDVYWRCPALGDLANWGYYALASQGTAFVDGWGLYIYTNALPNATARFACVDGAGGPRFATTAAFVLGAGNWYYVRGRISDANNMWVSIDAGAEANGWKAAGGTASASNLYLGQSGNNTHHCEGHECYVHVWANDQGALIAVPGNPFPIGGAARYIHSEGAGPVLGDTSGNGNNGIINGATWSPFVPPGWTL